MVRFADFHLHVENLIRYRAPSHHTPILDPTCCDVQYVMYIICGNVRPCSLLCVYIQSSVELSVHSLNNMGVDYDQAMTSHSKLHLF